jgi:hypothetical protein
MIAGPAASPSLEGSALRLGDQRLLVVSEARITR